MMPATEREKPTSPWVPDMAAVDAIAQFFVERIGNAPGVAGRFAFDLLHHLHRKGLY